MVRKILSVVIPRFPDGTPFGTDSFRKTWGRIVYQETGNLYLVSNVFNHSNSTKTLNFIGFNDDCDYHYSLKNEILI